MTSHSAGARQAYQHRRARRAGGKHTAAQVICLCQGERAKAAAGIRFGNRADGRRSDGGLHRQALAHDQLRARCRIGIDVEATGADHAVADIGQAAAGLHKVRTQPEQAAATVVDQQLVLIHGRVEAGHRAGDSPAIARVEAVEGARDFVDGQRLAAFNLQRTAFHGDAFNRFDGIQTAGHVAQAQEGASAHHQRVEPRATIDP